MTNGNFFLVFRFFVPGYFTWSKTTKCNWTFIKYYEALNLNSPELSSSRRNLIQFELHDQKNSKHDYFSGSCREVS